jgi:uroporphyrinogen decarboxylase
MNSRERLLEALRHREPDMVPLDLGGTENTTISRIAYQKLRSRLGMGEDPSPFVINRMMDAVLPRGDLLERFSIDCLGIRPSAAFKASTRELPDEESFYDELGIRWKKASYYYDMVEHPLRNASLEDLAKVRWPDPAQDGRFRGLREQARRLYETTDYALVAGHIMWGPFELGCALRGYQQFCIDLCTDEALARAVLENNLQLALRFWDAYLAEVGDYIQVAAGGDDLGMQTGTIISPEMYRSFVKPLHRRLYEFIRSRTKARIFLHSCGSVYDLIPDFIEAGVEILSPVQFSAAKMDLARLKREFGRDLTFWGGGVDTQHVLPEGSLAEIEDQVSRVFDIMGPGGGFVFVPVHNIQADIEPERVVAVYETAKRKRAYTARA